MRFYLKREESSSLLVLFAGWGMDQHPFLSLLPPERDVLIVFDYRSWQSEEILAIMAEYSSLHLLAWSMGVWVAQRLLAAREDLLAKVDFSVAINGTLAPIDAVHGIDPQVFKGMVDDFSPQVLELFNKKMCRRELSRFMADAPRRDLAGLHEELAHFYQEVVALPEGDSLYQMALVSKADMVILARNQEMFWQQTPIVSVPGPHFPFYLWRDLGGCLDFCRRSANKKNTL
ncbi:DUF452 family protein [Desulfotalea psychrophila]|uniref:Uncharacterized protein n=1 Tax=Desulfotalea psychrophila (strain LSv54 / DSM 12343) TaxID=177439 RepID=Q6AK51_DESPS|nr:pimeloyl-ACP methyl esterase BioG family protein [Desulfotalea psychrophila]CAG37275.1 hypothetical protein DP2546 [Desulfotalea psychrophila LSv54]